MFSFGLTQKLHDIFSDLIISLLVSRVHGLSSFLHSFKLTLTTGFESISYFMAEISAFFDLKMKYIHIAALVRCLEFEHYKTDT